MVKKSKLLLFLLFALVSLVTLVLFVLFAPLSILLMLYSFILAGFAFLAVSLYSWWLEKRDENPLILLLVPLALSLTGLFLILNGFYLAFHPSLGSIMGVVSDEDGKHLPSAEVVVDQPSGSRWWKMRVSLPRALWSNEAGEFVAAHLPPGEYKITVKADGRLPGRQSADISFFMPRFSTPVRLDLRLHKRREICRIAIIPSNEKVDDISLKALSPNWIILMRRYLILLQSDLHEAGVTALVNSSDAFPHGDRNMWIAPPGGKNIKCAQCLPQSKILSANGQGWPSNSNKLVETLHADALLSCSTRVLSHSGASAFLMIDTQVKLYGNDKHLLWEYRTLPDYATNLDKASNPELFQQVLSNFPVAPLSDAEKAISKASKMISSELKRELDSLAGKTTN